MRFKIYFKVILPVIGFFCLCSHVTAQSYGFINYGIEKDIPNGFVYTISQAKNGFLWVGTAAGLTRFDGYKFFPVQYPDSASGRYPTRSLKDKNGTLWFGCSDGSVFYEKDNKLLPVRSINNGSISELIEGPDELIYVIPQGKSVYTIDPADPAKVHEFPVSVEPVLLSGAFSNSGDLLIGTSENLLICRFKNDSLIVAKVIDKFESSGITSVHRIGTGSDFVIGTDGSGLFRLKLTGNVEEISRLTESGELSSTNVQSITEDLNNTYWISTTGSGVISFNFPESSEKITSLRFYSQNTGLAGNDVRTVFQDIEGNNWFGLYGEGISMLTSSSVSYYSPGKNSTTNNILYINKFENKYILCTPEGYHIFDLQAGKSIAYKDLSAQTGRSDIKSYNLDAEGNLWIGTGGNGLFVRSKNGVVKQFYRSGDTGSDDIKDIETGQENIWLSTTNGVIVLDRSGKLRKKFDINNGLPHNSINKIILIPSGEAFIGTESDRLYKIDKDFNIVGGNAVMSGSTRNKILSFAVAEDGGIWAATDGNGIFRFMGDTLTSVSRSNDLMSNFCYNIFVDSGNDIWVGHNKGISRFSPATGTVRIIGTDLPHLGVCNANAIYESGDNKVFIGTTEGFVVFDKRLEKKNPVAPFNNINIVEINDVAHPFQASFVLPYMKYKIKIYYSGINFSSPDKVFYSSYLENFDLDWSKMTTARDVLYSLSDGKYKFSLVSVNQDGLSQGAPVSFTILIKKPFYRTWWFALLSLGVLSLIVLLIIRERDKSQKKVQEYLEKELAARTSVVMKQKGEIELQNIEITDSINYAKRIQTSILPDINKLKESFEDAFILFHPRDIVSGDFYWFDKLEENKFVLVCADSTGHGVPGAFMSMIGSTLLQDIVTRKGISRPSEILSMLDKQIFSTLNQNVELGVSNDGMDMVVCEFNTDTRHIRFASAMRPVILVLDGESFYIKGNRSSVGGESVIEKFFDDQEYYLKQGDTVYLFSDGLPDQFGGSEGKKLKIARLKRMIEEIYHLPMDEQKTAMAKFYFDWKGTYDQVDDVLLMGVKV